MTDLEGLKQALASLTADLCTIFGARLRSLVVYGSHGSALDTGVPQAGAPADASPAGRLAAFDPGPTLHTLALVDRLTFDDLSACARHSADWGRRHYATPLILTAVEFERSLDAFPLEYGEILHHHAVLFGDSPFDRVRVQPEDLRRACEVQAKSHLVHLREAFIESGGKPDAVAALVAASARPFESLLRNIAHLQGAHARTRDELARHAEQAVGIPASVVHRVIALLHPADLSPSDAARLFPSYVEAVERLATYVDEWAR